MEHEVIVFKTQTGKESRMSDHRRWDTRGGLRAALAMAVVLALGGASWPSTSTAAGARVTTSGPSRALLDDARVATDWSSPNGGLYNQRVAASTISAANVSTLRIAWKLPLKGAGSSGSSDVANPVVANGVAYLQDGASNVMAVRLTTGRVLWTHRYNFPDYGPNGVTIANGRIYGITAKGVFALDARTGRQVWYTTRFAAGKVNFDMAPQVANGKVFVASALTVGGGILYALNARTGAIIWRFQTVADKIGQHLRVPSGGAWDAVLIGPDNSVYAWNRQSLPFAKRGANDSQSRALYRLPRQAESGHRQTGMVLPGLPRRLP